jgi:hypothetical protein
VSIPPEFETTEASLDLEWKSVYAPNRHPAIGVPYRRLPNRDKRASIQEVLDSNLEPTNRVLRIDYVHGGVEELPEIAKEFTTYLAEVVTGRYGIETLQPQYIIGEDIAGEPWLYSLVDKLEGLDEIKDTIKNKDPEGLRAYGQLMSTISRILSDAFEEGGKISSEILSPHQYALREVGGEKKPILFDVEPDKLMDLSVRGVDGRVLGDERDRLEEVFYGLTCEALDVQEVFGAALPCMTDIRAMLNLAVAKGLLAHEEVEPYLSGIDTGKKPFKFSEVELLNDL